MNKYKKNITNNNPVIVNTRQQKTVTCPYCWTEQRTERDFCYRCGAAFIYLDETVAVKHA